MPNFRYPGRTLGDSTRVLYLGCAVISLPFVAMLLIPFFHAGARSVAILVMLSVPTANTTTLLFSDCPPIVPALLLLRLPVMIFDAGESVEGERALIQARTF